MLKKIILSSLFVLIPSFSAFGCDRNFSKYYIKTSSGINTILPKKIEDNEFTGKIKVDKSFPLLEFAGGVNLDKTFRLEVAFDYYFLFFSNESIKTRDNTQFSVITVTQTNALMLNTYKDIITFYGITPFVGAGFGISTIQESARGNGILEDGTKFDLVSTSSYKVHRLAYKLTAGMYFQLDDRTDLELSYNYYNLGKNKPKLIEAQDNMRKHEYNIHNLLMGLRFKL